MVYPATLLSQVLQLISRPAFQQHARSLGSDRYSKGLSSWDQLVSMLSCRLAQAESLREICYGLRCRVGRLNHLGVNVDPKRSPLSYANAHRPWQLYQQTFYELLQTCRRAAPGKETQIRFPQQAAQPGRHCDRSVSEHASVGGVPATACRSTLDSTAPHPFVAVRRVAVRARHPGAAACCIAPWSRLLYLCMVNTRFPFLIARTACVGCEGGVPDDQA